MGWLDGAVVKGTCCLTSIPKTHMAEVRTDSHKLSCDLDMTRSITTWGTQSQTSPRSTHISLLPGVSLATTVENRPVIQPSVGHLTPLIRSKK